MLSHVRPDGDALGSQLALGLSLQKLGRSVRIWNEEGMLEKYSFLPRAELLTKPPATAEHVDVAIALDTAIQNRLGTTLAAVGSAKIWINIDHHVSNPGYGDLVTSIRPRPQRAEIIFRLIKSQGCRSTAISRKISSPRSQPIPVRFNIQTPPRARLKSPPSWCATAISTLGESASNFTRTIRAAGSNCCASCLRTMRFE